MIPLKEWITVFVEGYPFFKYAILFLGAAFGGEVGVIALAFLAAHKFFSFIPFCLVSILGTVSGDILWFYLGRTQITGKILNHRYAATPVAIIVEAIQLVSRGNRLIAFIFAKFLVGTRAVIIFYVSKTGIPFKKFILPDLVAIFIWLATLISIGYLSGLGFSYISSVLKNIYAGVGFILLIVIIVVMAQLGLKKFLEKKEKEIIKEENL